MTTKPMNGNKVRLAQAATGISPADYPLGSLESRAAVRTLLAYTGRMKPRLSEYDQDALTIFNRFPRFRICLAALSALQ